MRCPAKQGSEIFHVGLKAEWKNTELSLVLNDCFDELCANVTRLLCETINEGGVTENIYGARNSATYLGDSLAGLLTEQLGFGSNCF